MLIHLIIIIKPLTTAQHHFPNIPEILEDMYQQQQQRIINFYEIYGYNYIEYYEG